MVLVLEIVLMVGIIIYGSIKMNKKVVKIFIDLDQVWKDEIKEIDHVNIYSHKRQVAYIVKILVVSDVNGEKTIKSIVYKKENFIVIDIRVDLCIHALIIGNLFLVIVWIVHRGNIKDNRDLGEVKNVYFFHFRVYNNFY